jgi:hypothetical protein
MKNLISLYFTFFISLLSFAWVAPGQLSPTNVSTQWTGVTLDWYAVAGSQQYEVQLDTSLSFSSPAFRFKVETYINSSSSNTDTQEFFDDLYFGKTYFWRVRAWVPGDTSAWSSVWTFTTRNDVSLNSPAVGSLQWTGLTLDWNAHTGVDYYDLQVDTSQNFNSPAFQSFTDTYVNSASSNVDTDQFVDNLYFGATYFWRVRARNAVDTSVWTQRSFNTADYVNLNSPAEGSLQWTGLTLDWNAHTGVDYYDLQVDTSQNFNSPAFQSFTDTYVNSASSNVDTDQFVDNLYFGATYFWRVRARNTVDTTAWTMRSFNTADYVNLNTPAEGTLVWAGLTLDWFAHTGVDFYQLEADTSWAFNSPAYRMSIDAYVNSSSSNTDTDQFLDNLLFGAAYHWRVRAINAVDTSGWSTPRTFLTADYVNLTSPADGATIWTGNTFDWYAHTGVDAYDLEVDTLTSFASGALRTATTAYINSSSSNTDTQITFADLYFGKAYKWRVRASNAIDTTAWSEMRTAYTADYVNLVSPADQAINVSSAGVTLNWNAHTLVDYYQVQWDTTNLFNSPLLQTNLETYINSSSSNVDTDHPTGALLPNQVYFWRVRAINAVDTSEWTIRVFSTGSFIPNPGVPTLITPSNLATFVPTNPTFSWSATGNIQGYELQYGVNPNLLGATQITGTASSYSASGLLVDTTYYWRVRSYYGGTYSDWSSKWSFSTDVYVCTPTANSFAVSSCQSYLSPSGNYTWTTSGSYQDTLVNSGGCDSVLTIQVNILPALSSTSNVSACSSYYWATSGMTYTQSGTYSVLLTASTGCDSTAMLNLNINAPVSTVQSASACGTYYWLSNGQTYSNSGTYTNTLTAANGCDSVVSLNLTIFNPTSGTQQVNTCTSYYWQANGQTYTTSGTYAVTLTGANGCDSVATLILNIGQNSTSSQTVSSCGSYYWSATGTTYTAGGAYTATLSTVIGCDSIVTLNLTINQATSGSQQVSACESYYWAANGTNYTNSGIYTSILTAANGCDSLATLYLTVQNGFYSQENVQNCGSYVWPVNGMSYSTSGSYTAAYTGVNGCDSVYVLDLQVNTVDVTVVQVDNQLTAQTGNASYQWIDCSTNAPIAGATQQTFIAGSNGNYAVILEVNGCTDTSACYLVNTMDIDALSGPYAQIFPNPTERFLTVQQLAAESMQITIFDMFGKEVHTVHSEEESILLDLQAFPAGAYLLEIKNNRGITVHRLIKR